MDITELIQLNAGAKKVCLQTDLFSDEWVKVNVVEKTTGFYLLVTRSGSKTISAFDDTEEFLVWLLEEAGMKWCGNTTPGLPPLGGLRVAQDRAKSSGLEQLLVLC